MFQRHVRQASLAVAGAMLGLLIATASGMAQPAAGRLDRTVLPIPRRGGPSEGSGRLGDGIRLMINGERDVL